MDYSDLSEILNGTGDDAVYAFVGFMMLFLLIVFFFAIVFKIITRWVFFKKCGEEGWKSLIPVYTDYTLLKLSGLNWWWLLILYAGTILSTIRSTYNVLESSSTDLSFAPLIAVISVLSMAASLGALFARINEGYNLSRKFNKNGGYAALIILFEPIMLLVLGLSKDAKYDETVEVSPNGLIGTKPSKTVVYCPDCGTQVQEDYCPSCGKKVR